MRVKDVEAIAKQMIQSNLTDRASKLEVINLSDAGLKRPHNEDSCASDASLGLAVIADGMGGYKAGEVASAIAVTSIVSELKEQLAQLKPGQFDNPTGHSKESLLVKQAIHNANSAIFTMAQRDAQCQGMGTTVVLILFYDNRLTIAHVGDSRLYRLRGDTFEQLTNDHSLAQELVERGFFTTEEAAVHTPRNLITRALGIEASVKVDLQEDMVLPGDIYLLCTDGLNDMIDDEEIYLTLSKYSANLVTAAKKLVSKANQRGGHDNISVVLARSMEQFPAKPGGWYSQIFGWFTGTQR